MLSDSVNYQKLLLSLKGIVEGLLAHQVADVWSIYGGLNRLLWAVEKIFKSGCKTKNAEGQSDCWMFVNGLSQLEPSLAQHLSPVNENVMNLPEEICNDKAMIWVYKCLEEHSLSEKLQALLSDPKHLETYYDESAFFRQKEYADAVILCLKAVEQNQPSLLTDLDPSLYILDLKHNKFQRNHKRCSSLPEGQKEFFKKLDEKNVSFVEKDVEMPIYSSTPDNESEQVNINSNKEESIEGDSDKVTKDNKRCASLPNLNGVSLKSNRVRTNSVTKISPSVLQVKYDKVNRSCEKYETDSRVNLEMAVEEKRYRRIRNNRREIREWFVVQGEKEERKKTFMEDGGTSVLPMSTGYFPRPMQGQSLTSFLTSELFSRASAELDRENAHFSISEAMISAIEQIKCNRELRLIEDVNEDESDEEINRLKQRIRLRRRQRMEEKNPKQQLWSASLLSDGRTDTTTTDQSVSPVSTSPATPSESISTDDVDDFEVDEANNLKQLKNSELSVSMASLYSEADLSKVRKDAVETAASAENVALSLLRQFKEKQLPRASDLEWLVSEEDAPQELLPLPKSWPVNPDDGENSGKTTLLRGTSDWAPPRAQIIFTLHPPPVRRILLNKQNFRCAGCGLRVAQEYAHRFRYCEYLGRYFCTGCHSNQLAFIPGRILVKWDFNRYQVSTFSYRLLDQMSTDPLFRINDLNPELYKRTKPLERVRQLRLQLYYIKDFVLTCRFASQIREDLEREPSYLLNDPDMYSIQDLIQVKTGELRERLRELVKDSVTHIDTCQLCQARGFVCELCPSKEVIFPWFINKVSRCANCGSCFHLQCFKSGFCPRCARVSARKMNQSENDF